MGAAGRGAQRMGACTIETLHTASWVWRETGSGMWAGRTACGGVHFLPPIVQVTNQSDKRGLWCVCYLRYAPLPSLRRVATFLHPGSCESIIYVVALYVVALLVGAAAAPLRHKSCNIGVDMCSLRSWTPIIREWPAEGHRTRFTSHLAEKMMCVNLQRGCAVNVGYQIPEGSAAKAQIGLDLKRTSHPCDCGVALLWANQPCMVCCPGEELVRCIDLLQQQ